MFDDIYFQNLLFYQNLYRWPVTFRDRIEISIKMLAYNYLTNILFTLFSHDFFFSFI